MKRILDLQESLSSGKAQPQSRVDAAACSLSRTMLLLLLLLGLAWQSCSRLEVVTPTGALTPARKLPDSMLPEMHKVGCMSAEM